MVNWKIVDSDGIKIPATVWRGFFCGVGVIPALSIGS
jgi:hypothetical protein